MKKKNYSLQRVMYVSACTQCVNDKWERRARITRNAYTRSSRVVKARMPDCRLFSDALPVPFLTVVEQNKLHMKCSTRYNEPHFEKHVSPGLLCPDTGQNSSLIRSGSQHFLRDNSSLYTVTFTSFHRRLCSSYQLHAWVYKFQIESKHAECSFNSLNRFPAWSHEREG